MAIYKLQPATSRILGSRGGNTFQRCGQQFSIRKRAKPVLKKTRQSQFIRARFGSIQSTWRQRSVAQRTTWGNAAPNFLRVDSLGNNYELERLQLFTSSNLSRRAFGMAALNSIPVSGVVIGYGQIINNFDISSNNWVVPFTPNPVPANYRFAILAGPTQSDNNSSPALSNMKVIRRFNPGNNTSINIATLYRNLFPNVNLSAGRYIPIGRMQMQQTTGQLSVTIAGHALIVP